MWDGSDIVYEYDYSGSGLYERPSEVVSMELLGNSSLLPVLGFAPRDVVLFTADDDYRQVLLACLLALCPGV